jgi:hypothetical protein
MPTNNGEPVAYGPYSLLVNLSEGARMMIRRDDGDRKRTVALIDTLGQWDRFVAALEAGSDEVAAVHAVDER